MKKFSKYIGPDVHKETIALAVAEERGEASKPVAIQVLDATEGAALA